MDIIQILKRINQMPCDGQLTSELKAQAKKLGFELIGYNCGYMNRDWRYKIKELPPSIWFNKTGSN